MVTRGRRGGPGSAWRRGDPGRRRGGHHICLPGRGEHGTAPGADAFPEDPHHSAAARAGRRFCRGWLRAGDGAGRGLRGDEGTRGDEGVDTIFAYPGGASMELHQALTRSRKIRTILPRHEQGGAFAADGYARATGRAGVCVATRGPGATKGWTPYLPTRAGRAWNCTRR